MMWQRVVGRTAIVGLLFMVGLTGCGGPPATKPIIRPTKVFVATKTPTYPIKFKTYADVGKSVDYRERQEQKEVLRIRLPDGKMDSKERALINETVYIETVLEMGESKPKKFKRFYTLARTTLNEQTRTEDYEGRIVIFELKGDQYEVRAEGTGKPLSEEDAKRLALRVRKPEQTEVFLPKEPVKVGESWPIDIEKLAKFQGQELDLPNSTGKATLLKVTDAAGGQLNGVIELNITFAVRSMLGRTYDPPAKFELKGTLETSVGGASTAGAFELHGEMTGKGTLQRDGQKLTEEKSMMIGSSETRSTER